MLSGVLRQSGNHCQTPRDPGDGGPHGSLADLDSSELKDRLSCHKSRVSHHR